MKTSKNTRKDALSVDEIIGMIQTAILKIEARRYEAAKALLTRLTKADNPRSHIYANVLNALRRGPGHNSQTYDLTWDAIRFRCQLALHEAARQVLRNEQAFVGVC
jgi:hypothetical protein